MRKTTIALGLVAVLLGFTYAYAHGPGFGPGGRGETCWESWGAGKTSNLTPEQESKFQELRQKFNEETAQLRGTILTKRLELQSLWTNPKADPKAIADKEKELRDLQNQMGDKIIEFKLEARKSLTPDQIAEYGKGRRRGPGFGRGHMMGYGPGMGYGHEMGPGHGMDYGHGMGPGYGPCH